MAGLEHIISGQAFFLYGLGALVLPLVALLWWFRVTARRRAEALPALAATVPPR